MRTNKIRQIYSRIPKRGVAGCLLLAAGIILTALAANVDGLAQWYSRQVYPVWVNLWGRLCGIFPFSVAEILLYLLGAGFLLSLGRLIWRLIRAGKCGSRQSKGQTPLSRRQILASWGSGFLLAAGVLYFLYVLNCGINYYRTSFSESSGITMETYSVEELTLVCRKLTEEVNERSGRVERDTDGVMWLDAEENGKVQERAVEAMQELGTVYPELSGYFLAGITYDDPEFQYSSYLTGWIYCMNVLRDADEEAWEQVRSGLSREVEPDLLANSRFWARYDGAAAEAADRINDQYLQANGQKEGIKSYDRMVDLIVEYYCGGTAEK